MRPAPGTAPSAHHRGRAWVIALLLALLTTLAATPAEPAPSPTPPTAPTAPTTVPALAPTAIATPTAGTTPTAVTVLHAEPGPGPYADDGCGAGCAARAGTRHEHSGERPAAPGHAATRAHGGTAVAARGHGRRPARSAAPPACPLPSRPDRGRAPPVSSGI
ncbi:hypothetical protein [Streptomyces sp. NPDC006134]|uniref:hypothetical protein n=1 Tax=Streptomyces sp. NPDC006134 TaxID=3154467 RepID=UPI0033F310FF